MADISQGRAAVCAAREVLDESARRLASQSMKDGRLDLNLMDEHQIACYDLAYLVSGLESARCVLTDYAEKGQAESLLALGFAADVVSETRQRLDGRLDLFGVEPVFYQERLASGEVEAFLTQGRSGVFADEVGAAVLGGTVPGGPVHLPEDLAMMAHTFRQFGADRICPVVEHVHRENTDIPEDIIQGVAELGCFGLTIPEAYGGYAGDEIDPTIAMVVATEQLSWASLGVGGALITRPEILSKAIVSAGTEEQKNRWLPKIASGENMVGVAVTEPDYGSDVASLKVRAGRTADGTGYLVQGVKTWCTFAGRADLLMLLARTGAPEEKHRGLSLFVIPKTRHAGHAFVEERVHDFGTGKMEGRAIDTLGYRGMHSYEISFDNWFVPVGDMIGTEEGKGFYMQMDAFANGRAQTAARAVGLMQAAFEKALSYSRERVVFGKPIYEYPLTRWKLARMAWLIQACRQHTYEVAGLLSQGGKSGQLEASMVKMYACRAAEWVSREALQIHGGMGYAEEYDVSRYFVDARVLSIFEGAEETLALRVIIRRLLEQAV